VFLRRLKSAEEVEEAEKYDGFSCSVVPADTKQVRERSHTSHIEGVFP
jgi:hypothetical protein